MCSYITRGFITHYCGDEVFEMTLLLVDDGLYFGQQLVELEDADATISLVAFRVEAQLLHCTREWYSSHWARRSSAGRRAHPQTPTQQL